MKKIVRLNFEIEEKKRNRLKKRIKTEGRTINTVMNKLVEMYIRGEVDLNQIMYEKEAI